MRAVIVSLVGSALCGAVMAAQSASDLAKGDAAKGKATYAERKCATCHRTDKADDEGGKMATILGDTVAKLSPAELKSWLTDTADMEAKLPKPPAVKMSDVHQESEAGAHRGRRRQSRRVSEDAAGQILMVSAPISDLPRR